jgi:peptide/nickel transport system permease protein
MAAKPESQRPDSAQEVGRTDVTVGTPAEDAWRGESAFHEAPSADHEAEVRHGLVVRPGEPLWRIRVKLAARTLLENWRLFRENAIGLVGLAIILLFGVMALAHPILMGTVWEKRVYDPVTGYDAPILEKTVVEEVTDPASEIDLVTARLRVDPLAGPGDIVEVRSQPAPPSAGHLLGTDALGRDILSQLMFSTRAAFAMGAVAAFVTVFLATIVGSVAAYFGGLPDAGLMRLADLILVMPLIPLLIVVSGLFSLSLVLLGLIIGLLNGFGATAIVLKSQALSVKVKPYVDAARVSGGGHWHVISRHIIPNVLPLSFLYMMFTVTEAISLEAVLSFFGLLEVTMSWGIMLNTTSTAGYLLRGIDFWWLVIPPGAAVTFLAAAFFFVGRAMDEVVNPRLRGR